jgi:hypothetical protein
MSEQAAILIALAFIAAIAALGIFASWIAGKKGKPK